MLKDFTFETIMQGQQDCSNSVLREAWKEAKERYVKLRRSSATNDLAYWKDKLMAKQIQQEFDGEDLRYTSSALDSKMENSTKKRKHKHGSDTRGNAVDDEEPDAFFDPKIKKEATETEEYNPFAKNFATSMSSSKRSRPNSSGNFSRRLGSPFSYKSSALTTPIGELQVSKSPDRPIKQKKPEVE